MLLLIDNYDSFTYNLVHYLSELGADVAVKRNDALTADEAIKLNADHIVLSPGPCGPEQAGICLELIQKAAAKGVPLLGVCLGHQCIGQAFGGKVMRAPVPIHGKVSAVHHEGRDIFHGLPSPLQAARYHSLVVSTDGWPSSLEVTAKTEDGLVMGLRHKQKPVYGVQFHPESIATDHGHAMLKNFLASAAS